jgi:hypothetical protein
MGKARKHTARDFWMESGAFSRVGIKAIYTRGKVFI